MMSSRAADKAGAELSHEEAREILVPALERFVEHGDSVLVVIPDGTRSGPIPEMFEVVCETLSQRADGLDFLVALGTHRPMSEEQLDHMVGMNAARRRMRFGGASFGEVGIFNHEWWRPEALVTLGEIPSDEVGEISGGLLDAPVEVRVNKLLLEYDRVLVCGPVFPHEVVGFSGGNKYFFPGVSGPEVIAVSHWLGALITSYEIIGKRGTTPVRRLIDRAAAMIPASKLCAAMVVAPDTGGLAGLYVDEPVAAWEAASAHSERLHVRYLEHPVEWVLSMIPEGYEDIWTAAKGMYKLEPVVADGGEVVIYAPHITEFSYSHGKELARVGYHVRDYFLANWERCKQHPWTVLAHSTHLKGAGRYDETLGERPRVNVTLATGISESRCLKHNVGYRDPDTIDPERWAQGESEQTLVVPRAGETLYRLRYESKYSLKG